MAVVCVDLGKRAGEIKTLQDVADDVESQGQNVGDENRSTSLVRFGEEQENNQEDQGSTDLRSEVDAYLDVVKHEFVELRQRYVQWCPVSQVECDGLGERIREGRVRDCHAAHI